MKWYFASRTRYKEKINLIIKTLENVGETISYNWSSGAMFIFSEDTKKEMSNMAKDIGLAIRDTDIFVLISDKQGIDMFVELGLMLHHCLYNPKAKIYIIGEYGKRSLMSLHPGIKHLDSLRDVFNTEIPNIKLPQEIVSLEFGN